jgi:hypothetical protein
MTSSTQENHMNQPLLFGEVVDAADQLSVDEQEALVEIVRRRLAERGRKMLACEAEEAVQEFMQGRCRITTVDDLMKEIRS